MPPALPLTEARREALTRPSCPLRLQHPSARALEHPSSRPRAASLQYHGTAPCPDLAPAPGPWQPPQPFPPGSAGFPGLAARAGAAPCPRSSAQRVSLPCCSRCGLLAPLSLRLPATGSYGVARPCSSAWGWTQRTSELPRTGSDPRSIVSTLRYCKGREQQREGRVPGSEQGFPCSPPARGGPGRAEPEAASSRGAAWL